MIKYILLLATGLVYTGAIFTPRRYYFLYIISVLIPIVVYFFWAQDFWFGLVALPLIFVVFFMVIYHTFFYYLKDKNLIKSIHCIPCRKGDPALSAEEVNMALKDLPGWELSENGTAVTRKVKFKDYSAAFQFVQAVSELAEAEDHHPDVHFGWGYAEITFITHAIGGLHSNDLLMARKTSIIIDNQ